MILSISVYLFLATVLYVLARGSYETTLHGNIVGFKQKPFFSDWQIIASILFFAVVCGIRYNVGVDNLAYIKHYVYYQEHGEFLRKDYEPLFAWVQKTMASAGFHYSVFNGLWAAIQITFIYYALRNDKKYLPYVALMIVLSPVYLNWMNGVRQCVVECAFFFLVEYIEKKQMWKYLLGVFLCTFIHSTAIILLPMYFLLQKPFYFNKWWIRIAIFLFFTYLGSQTEWFKSMSSIVDVLENFGYERYANGLDATMEIEQSKAWGPQKIALFLLDIFAIVLFPGIIKKHNLGKKFEIYFCVYFWGACCFRLFFDLSLLFYRIASYFYDFYIIIIPVLFYYFYRERRYFLFYSLVFLALFFGSIYSTLKFFITGGTDSEVYKFFFLE